METKNLTILFADLVGSTEMSMTFKRGEDLKLKTQLKNIFNETITNFGGKLIKTIGDGYLIVFDSPTDGVLCGMKIQDNIKQWAEKEFPSMMIKFRIGIHTGEVSIDEDGDIFGAAANIASRIETCSEPGRVFISSSTYQAMNKAEINAFWMGGRELKGVNEKIGVYKVLFENETMEKLAADEKNFSETIISDYEKTHFGWRFLAAFIDLILMGIIAKGLFARPKLPFVAVIIYFIGLWTWKSASLGKMIVGLKIVDKDTHNNISFKQSIIRFLGYIISLLPLGLGFFWMIWDKEKQGWHDKLAKTFVLKKKKTTLKK